MSDLVEFLLTRLAEREAVALAAAEDDGYLDWDIPSTGVVQVAGGDLDGLVIAPRNAAIHMAGNDPARVLAEVAAKRRIVSQADTVIGLTAEDPGNRVLLGAADAYRAVLRLLAAIDHDRPDYDPSWAPD